MNTHNKACGWILGAIILAACQGGPTTTQKTEQPVNASAPNDATEPDATSASRWVPVQDAHDAPAFEVLGRLLPPPNARAELTLPLPATVLRVLVDHGQRVQSGTPLVEVAMPEVARAAARLQGARLRMQAYRSRLAQLQALRSEGLARGADLADAQARLAEANADEVEALAVQRTVEAAGLRRHGDDYQVVAPLAGVVVEVNAPLGSMRGPSDGSVVVIAGGDPTRIEARFAFPVPKQAKFEWVEGPPDARALQLVAEAPEIMPNDATRLVWFDAPRPIQLPHGTIVHVRVIPPADTWLVPRAAVHRDATHASVITRRAGAVAVEVLINLGNDSLVHGPLQTADMIAEEQRP